MLEPFFTPDLVEAGCDEAGRGCLAGPVFAAAVILPHSYRNETLNDSKQLSRPVRDRLRAEIERDALAWAVARVEPAEIDVLNILWASVLAMQRAVSFLTVTPQLLLVDGNRFRPVEGIPHRCFVKGDARFLSIAAASVLAKTHRDEYMALLHEEFPQYDWLHNQGYPAPKHRQAIARYGITPHHRKSFRPVRQLTIPFER
jgi:ribonuclease HII